MSQQTTESAHPRNGGQQMTFSPDPQHLVFGAGTADAQEAEPRQYASPDHFGYVTSVPQWATAANSDGTWNPPGAYHPNSMQPEKMPVANPTTAWTAGQYVTLDDGAERYWDGTEWRQGRA